MPNHVKNSKVNPNIRIYDSYKIHNKDERSQILDILFFDENFNSSIYQRGKSSWMKEWNGHNDLYRLFYFTPYAENLKNVDLDENELIPWDWYVE